MLQAHIGRRITTRACPVFFRRLSSIQSTQHPIELASLVAQPTVDKPTKPSLVILHGLFGSKRNWTSLHKTFHRALPHHSIHTLDLRNHGASPHISPMTYTAMAQDVLYYIHSNSLTNVALLGHSMGGKVAMALALMLAGTEQETLLSHLLVSDIAPTRAELSPDFVQYINAMIEVNDLPLGAVRTRSDVDILLQKYESDLGIRQFLLTNLVLPRTAQNPTKPQFGLPLDVLKRSISELGSFPYDPEDPRRPRWNGKTLVFRGTKSFYINNHNQHAFGSFFPNLKFEYLDAGHWVHAEQPNEFKDLTVKFIQS